MAHQLQQADTVFHNFQRSFHHLHPRPHQSTSSTGSAASHHVRTRLYSMPPLVTNISPLEYREFMINIDFNVSVGVIRITPPHLRGANTPLGPPAAPPLEIFQQSRRDHQENYTEEYEDAYNYLDAYLNYRVQREDDTMIINGDTVLSGGLPDGTIGRCLKKRRACPADRDDGKVCSVCLEDLGVDNKSEESMTIGVLDCRHEFHVRCIQQWLKRKNACPLCRASALG